MPLRLQEKTITLTCSKCGKTLIVDKLAEAVYWGWKDDVCKECIEKEDTYERDSTKKGISRRRDQHVP